MENHWKFNPDTGWQGRHAAPPRIPFKPSKYGTIFRLLPSHMKTYRIALTLFLIALAAAQAQNTPAVPPAGPSAWQVVDRGPHHRVWRQTTYVIDAQGNSATIVRHFTELAIGLHYQGTNGQWQDSQE